MTDIHIIISIIIYQCFIIIIIIVIVITVVMIIYIITILCYAPSDFTCIVGGAIQMTVYICIYICKTCHE